MATVYSFHGGPPLNVWERCSLQSFADQGHEVVLFSYDRLDVPRGVRLESADSIVTIEERDKFFAVAPDRYSQFSDFFATNCCTSGAAGGSTRMFFAERQPCPHNPS